MANRAAVTTKRRDSSKGDNFRVAVRVRPLIARETRSNLGKVNFLSNTGMYTCVVTRSHLIAQLLITKLSTRLTSLLVQAGVH